MWAPCVLMSGLVTGGPGLDSVATAFQGLSALGVLAAVLGCHLRGETELSGTSSNGRREQRPQPPGLSAQGARSQGLGPPYLSIQKGRTLGDP